MDAAAGSSENKPKEEEHEKSKEIKKKKQQRGLLSRIWNGLFGSRKDDFERRLERISKEEAAVLSRIRRRSQSWGRMRRHLILFSVVAEFAAVANALMAARLVENWKRRAFRILPVFLLPVFSSITYSAFVSFMKMCDRKDHKTLEKLRAERKAKIDELKERTNYYITQRLIQQYDTDPAAKAAAATVLASKLSADSGLKVRLGDDSKHNAPAGKSNDIELVQSGGLQNRKESQISRSSSSLRGTILQHPDEAMSQHRQSEHADYNRPHFHHYQGQGPSSYNSRWLARIAALLVGEDPTQCYALVCGNCHMHNGLASKEDFPYITYICPHCHAVNGPKHKPGLSSSCSTPNTGSSLTAENTKASSTAVSSPRDIQLDNSNYVAADVAASSGIKGIEQTVVVPRDEKS